MILKSKFWSLNRFQSDLLWNFVSFGVIGVSGLLLNIIIAYFYETVDLGVFNQCYAIYVVAARFAAFGTPPSVLNYIAQNSGNPSDCKAIVSSALTIAFLFSVLMSAAIWLFRGCIGDILNSEDVANALNWVAPSIVLFSLNKIMMTTINGYRMMKRFAFFQCLRFFLMLLTIIVMVLTKWPGNEITAIFAVSEVILFIAFLLILKKKIFTFDFKKNKYWFSKNFNFGLKSFVSESLMDLNTRIDVLMLGFFASDKVVGIYSYSAMLAEGLGLMTTVVMFNSTPILIPIIANREFEKARVIIRKIRIFTYKLLVPLGMASVVTYPLWMKYITNNADYMEGWAVFTIIVFSISIVAGYLPFKKIFQVCGKPGLHSIITIGVVLINIALNLLLIPYFGMVGAAISTSISIVIVFVYVSLFINFILR